MSAPVFTGATAIAMRWRAQIAAVEAEREALRKTGGCGGRVGALTRRIKDMEAQLSKLLTPGASHE